MASRITATVYQVDGDTVILIEDQYAKSFLVMPDEAYQRRTWEDIWYDLLTEDGFDDLLSYVEADHENCIVKVDENNLPIQLDESRIYEISQ